MNLDEALSQPLAPVHDDGFSARVILAQRRAEEKRRLLLWGAGALSLLPPLWGLSLLPGANPVGLLAAMAASPVYASAAGALVLLWALLPRAARP